MNLKTGLCLLMCLLAFGLVSAQKKSRKVRIRELLQSAEKLERLQNQPAALSRYLSVLDLDRDNFEALWKSATLLIRVGDRISDDETRTDYFVRAEKYARRAIEAAPDSSVSHQVLGLVFDKRAAEFSGKEMMEISDLQLRSAMEAIKLDIHASQAWFLLGKWHYRMANLKPTDKAMAGILWGNSQHREASNQHAARAFELAVKYDPEGIEYYYYQALAFEAMKRKDLAVPVLETCLEVTPKGLDEPVIQEKCRDLLSRFR